MFHQTCKSTIPFRYKYSFQNDAILSKKHFALKNITVVTSHGFFRIAPKRHLSYFGVALEYDALHKLHNPKYEEKTN